jgi:hypothetical protein
MVEVIRLLGNVRLPSPEGAVFDIYDYLCRPSGGALDAGDDAEETRWCDRDTLAALPIVSGLVEALTQWHSLPR